MTLASIPSPCAMQCVWHVGPVPIRAYALSIILGVIVAAILANRAWVKRGGRHGTIYDITIWAVPFGLVGSRLYHVATDWQLYFGEGANPWRAFQVWEGGLGIWGGVALGAVGAWIGCKIKGISLAAVADTAAPYIVLAQGIGRWGNWFNQELFGRPTTLPWGVEITPGLRPEGYETFATFHPTFLYEFLWDVGVCLLVIWAIKKFALGHGRGFALYVALYTLGRGWIEYLRIDEVHNHILGLRFNIWTSIVLFLLAIVYLIISAKLRPGVETDVEAPEPGPEPGKAEDKAEDKADGKADDKAEDAEDKAESAADEEPAERAGEQQVGVDAKSEPDDAKPAEDEEPAERASEQRVSAEAKSDKPE